MNKTAFRLLSALLAVLLLATGLCGCDKGDTDEPHKVVHEDITDYCYIGQTANTNTYVCTVVDAYGYHLFHKEKLSQPPTVEAVDDDVLKISQQFGAMADGSWAIYCNIETSQTTALYQKVLATEGRIVVYTDYLTNAHQIFVQDAWDEAEYFQCYTLTDADQGNAVLGGNRNEEGDLVVTYLSGGKEKTTVIELP